jgi:hypothetical protein
MSCPLLADCNSCCHSNDPNDCADAFENGPGYCCKTSLEEWCCPMSASYQCGYTSSDADPCGKNDNVSPAYVEVAVGLSIGLTAVFAILAVYVARRRRQENEALTHPPLIITESPQFKLHSQKWNYETIKDGKVKLGFNEAESNLPSFISMQPQQSDK